jgi:hypothetical protein
VDIGGFAKGFVDWDLHPLENVAFSQCSTLAAIVILTQIKGLSSGSA